MLGANGPDFMFNSLGKRMAEFGRIKGVATNSTANKVHRHNLIPVTPQEMLELHGLIGTNSPAITAPCASGHVMEQFSRLPMIRIIQGTCGAILYAGETPITVVVHLKKRHD